MPDLVLYSIGHSNHPIERFLERLRQHGIERVIDVRTHPHSRYVPQYNGGPLQAALAAAGVDYAHLAALGGKPNDPALQTPEGAPDYDRIQTSAAFLDGIEALLAHAQERRVAMLCAEADPQQCHRERLIAPVLRARGVEVRHILPDGSLAPPPLQTTLGFE